MTLTRQAPSALGRLNLTSLLPMKIHLRLAALLALCAAAFGSPSGLHAQTAVSQPAAIVIKTVPFTINQPGFYQLGADLTYAGNPAVTNDAIITIAAGNVTLDFAGHYISGPGGNKATTLYGVYSYNQGNNTIKNGIIAFCYDGMYFDGPTTGASLNINNLVHDMTITYCYRDGVYMGYASTSQVNNCSISTIGGSTVSTHANGIYFLNVTNGQVANNTVTAVTGASGVTGSQAATAYGVGIYCFTGTSTATGNTVANVTAPSYASSGYGIFGVTFARKNNVSGCYYGLYSCHKYQDTLTDNCNTSYYNDTTDCGGNF